MPPDSWSGNESPTSSRPTNLSTSSARASRSAFGTPWISSPNATLSTTRRCARRPKCWKTIDDVCRRSSRSSVWFAAVMSRPSISTRPAVGSISLISVRTSVDFPEPARPITTKTSRGQTSNETSRTAATQLCFARSSLRESSASGVPTIRSALRPKIFQTPCTLISGAPLRSTSCPKDPAVSATVATATPYSDVRWNPSSKQSYRASLAVDVDVDGSWVRPVPGHRLHVAAERDDPPGAGVGAQVAHRDREAGRRIRERRVVGEGEMRLGHADRQQVDSGLLELLDLVARSLQQEDPVGAVDPLRDRLDLLLDGGVERVEEVEVRRLVGGRDNRFGQRGGARAALREPVVDLCGVSALLERELADELDLLGRVAREAVDRDHGVDAELAYDAEVAGEIRRPGLDRIEAAVGVAGVMLQRLDGRDEHHRVRPEATRAADDVEELLHAHVGAESGLGHDVVPELQRDAVGDERVVAVRDVREGPAVDERGLPLERLHEVRLDRVLQQNGHRPGGAQLLGRHRLAFECPRDRDRAEALTEILEIGCDG